MQRKTRKLLETTPGAVLLEHKDSCQRAIEDNLITYLIIFKQFLLHLEMLCVSVLIRENGVTS